MFYLDIVVKNADIFEWIRQLLGYILDGIYRFLDMFGINNVALCIVIFTILIRTLLIPSNIKTQKSSRLNNIVQPEIAEIQKKYRNKKDNESQMKMQQEVMAVYEKYGTSPTAGCLTSLITLPIMFALYRVVTNIPDYVPAVRTLYEGIATALVESGNDGYKDILTQCAKDISTVTYEGSTKVNDIINVLKNFNTGHWNDLISEMDTVAITDKINEIKNINSFWFGLNIADAPKDVIWPGILVPVFSVLTQWYSMWMVQSKNKDNKALQDNPMMQSMNTMMIVMPIMSGFICYTLPLGIGIYWIVGSVYTIVQQFIVGKYMDSLDMDKLIAMNKKKAKAKAEKKEKSAFWNKMNELKENAMQEMGEGQNTGSSSGKTMSISDYAKMSSKNIVVNNSKDMSNNVKNADKDNVNTKKDADSKKENTVDSKNSKKDNNTKTDSSKKDSSTKESEVKEGEKADKDNDTKDSDAKKSEKADENSDTKDSDAKKDEKSDKTSDDKNKDADKVK